MPVLGGGWLLQHGGTEGVGNGAAQSRIVERLLDDGRGERLGQALRSVLTLAAAQPAEDNGLLLANDAFCRLSGYSREDILGKNCRFLQGARTELPARAEIRRAIEAGRDAQVLITNYRSDGSEFVNLLFIYALTDASRMTTYFMGSQFEVKLGAAAALLDRHVSTLDQGIDRILKETSQMYLKTRQLLAQTAVSVVRARMQMSAG